MRWTWDADKSRSNERDHGLDFETAALVFEDEFAVTTPDPHPDGNRLRTVGRIGIVTLFVVHTWPQFDEDAGEEVGRIISARKATPRERKKYEEEEKRG